MSIAEMASTAVGQGFLEAAESVVRRVAEAKSESERSARKASLTRFMAKGIPGHKDEEWKYTSLRLLSESRFAAQASLEPDTTLLDRISGLGEGPRAVFWNGKFRPELSSIVGLGAGVHVRSLASGEPPQGLGSVASLEGKLGSTNDERFVWLNASGYEDGLAVDLDDRAVMDKPLQVVFLSGGQALSFPRVYIKLGQDAQAKIVEFHAGIGSYATFPVAEIDLSRGAILEHTRLQDESAEAFHIGTLAVSQSETSTYTSNSVQFGARIGRLDANVWVGGEHCETWLNGAYVGTGEQHLDNHTRIDHALPNCHSFEVYKGILADRANGVFNGKIFVYPDAQKTDAKQTNQALLLSPTATVDTKPQLEIFADDVKCTHGATVGQLREEAMFYLRSRGLPKEEARNLLVYAFVAEVLERISIESVRDAFEARLFQKLAERRH